MSDDSRSDTEAVTSSQPKRGTMNENAMVLLLDQPEDECCEDRGWVSAHVPVEDARDLLAPYCADENGAMPARPVGEPQRVWLKPDESSSAYADEWRWHPCATGEGVEFWEFDATDVRAVHAT